MSAGPAVCSRESASGRTCRGLSRVRGTQGRPDPSRSLDPTRHSGPRARDWPVPTGGRGRGTAWQPHCPDTCQHGNGHVEVRGEAGAHSSLAPNHPPSKPQFRRSLHRPVFSALSSGGTSLRGLRASCLSESNLGFQPAALGPPGRAAAEPKNK